MGRNNVDGHATALGSGGGFFHRINNAIKWAANEHDKAENRKLTKHRIVQAGQRLKQDAYKQVSRNYENLMKYHNATDKLNEKRKQRQSTERMHNGNTKSTATPEQPTPSDPKAGDGTIQQDSDSPYTNPFEADYFNWTKHMEDVVQKDYHEGKYKRTNNKKPHNNLWTKIKDLFVRHSEEDGDVGNNQTPQN